MEKFQAGIFGYILILLLMIVNFGFFCFGVSVGRIDSENRIKNKEILEKSEKIENFPTLDFPGQDCFLERILKKIGISRIFPIDKSANCGYNRGITKNGIAKSWNLFATPDSKPNRTRFTASHDFTRMSNSCKRFIATNERTAS